ncbi:hypothetical protein BH11PSE3_BH11PSE3_07770 [soil metagenome]
MSSAGIARVGDSAPAPEEGGESENLQMPDGTWVIADGRSFRLCGPEIAGNPFLFQHLLDAGTPQHTRQLLGGALMAGLQSGRRNQPPVEARAPSLERYIHSLAGAYVTTSATPRTMRAVAERFRSQGNTHLVEHCLGVADEETGHDLLVVKDLEALGLRSAALVKEVQPATAVALVDLFGRLAEGAAPVAVLGYAYALERSALSKTPDVVAAIEAIIPTGRMATRCLRVHSAAGTDAGHVAQSLEFIAGLDGTDRAHIAWAAFKTAETMSVPDGYPGDDVFREFIAAYRR